MWTFGSNDDGRTGHGITQGHQSTPKKVEGGFFSPSLKVVFIATGHAHSACITEDGSTYTWGDGGDGRLGHHLDTTLSSPKLVIRLVGKRAEEVACGWSHTLVRTEDGRVFSFGYGGQGQLGHGGKESRLTPKLIEAPPLKGEFVVQVACGANHSMALTRKGCVYTWGRAADGILGHDAEVYYTTPRFVEALNGKNIVNISTNNVHSVALVDCKQEEESYSNNMKAMINDESCSDVVFVLESGDLVHANKGLLIGRSEYFRAMFRSNMRENRENKVAVGDCSKDVFLLLLEYLYTGGVAVGMDHALGLYVLADRYQVNWLSRQCLEVVIEKGLSNENAIYLLAEADGLCLDDLKDVCMSYVVLNYDKVMNEEVVKYLSHGLSEELLMALQKEATLLRGSLLLQCGTPSITDSFIIYQHLFGETILSLLPVVIALLICYTGYNCLDIARLLLV
jgi:hypothetical protein